jgi:hypothetical protein
LGLKFIKKALKHPNALLCYFALTRQSAKDIFWSILHGVVERAGIKADFIESRLEVHLHNGSIIKLYGADMNHFIKRVRGIKTPMAAVDEAGEFGSHIESLIDDILVPATSDYKDGQIILTGTPGRIPYGYFYDVTGLNKYGYSNHKWSILDNPFMPDAKDFIEEMKQKKAWDESNPTYLREWCGQWVKDVDSLVFKYDPIKNNYSELPNSSKWEYVIGVDIGFNDADAITVLGWCSKDNTTYLIEEETERGRDITSLVSAIAKLVKKYDPLSIVMDTGGLGKKIAVEITNRYDIAIKAAEKSRKLEYIELLNDAMRTGMFKAKNTSGFANDCLKVEWDKKTPDKLIVSDKFHSDLVDSALYAWRESQAFLTSPELDKPDTYTDEWYKNEEIEMINGITRRLTSEQNEDEW